MKKIIVKLHATVPKILKKIIERIVMKIEHGEFWSLTLREIYKQNYGMDIGIGTYGCFKQNNLSRVSKIGNYCSIASGFEFLSRNHPKEYASTHPMFFNDKLGFINKSPIEFSELEIGHDVWIGKNVLVTSKCKSIGNGAIIGAGGVVTKNVPPYTIVAGNPARVIGRRFEDNSIEILLEESKWYNLTYKELKKYIKWIDNPKKFAKVIIEDYEIKGE